MLKCPESTAYAAALWFPKSELANAIFDSSLSIIMIHAVNIMYYRRATNIYKLYQPTYLTVTLEATIS